MRKDQPAAPPSLIKARLGEIRTVSRALDVNYRALFGASLDRTVRDSVKVQGSTADPTGDLVADPLKQSLRRACVEIDRRVERAFADLESALRLSAVALDRLDPPDVPFIMDKRRVTKEQLAEARDAQDRRIASGEE